MGSAARWWRASCLLLLLALTIVVFNVTHPQWWWSGTEVDIPRDGAAHRVELAMPGGDYALWSDQSLVDPVCVISDRDGIEVIQRRVPKDERAVVEVQGIAKPEASGLFVAPPSGFIAITCDHLVANPVQNISLGSAPSRPMFDVLSLGSFVLGPVLMLATMLAALLLAMGALRGQDTSTPRPIGR